MSGTNPLLVDIVAKTDGLTAGLTKAQAQVEAFTASVNKGADAQAVKASEATIAQSAQATAQAWVASRRAMMDAETRAAALLKAGKKAEVSSLSDSLTEMEQRRDAFLGATQAYYDSLGSTRAAAFAAQEAAANKEIEAEYQRLSARLEDATAVDADTAALGENTVALTFNAQAQRELSYSIGEVATGRYGRLETSMFSLAARTGLMAKVMSPAGAAVAAFAAAAGTLAFALIEGERESAAFNSAILATGNAAGITEGQFNIMAQALAGTDATVGTAREALLALAQSGKFTGDTLEQAAQGAIDFADLTGQSMKQATTAIERLATDPAQAIAKLNEQYHFLSASQFEHIQDLQQEGDAVGATQAAVEAFAAAMHERATQERADTHGLAAGWDDVKDAISGAWDALKSIGRDTTVDDKIASLKAQIAGLGANSGVVSFAGYASEDDVERERQALEAKLKTLEAQKQQQAAAAQQKAKQDQVTQAAITAEQQYQKQLDTLKAHNVALEKTLALRKDIEAIHAANPNSPLLKGDVFNAQGALTKGNSTYAEMVSRIQHQFDQHPLRLRMGATGATAESTSGIERMIADDERMLTESQRVGDLQAQSAERVDQTRVASAKQAMDEAVAAGHMSAAQREAIEQSLTQALYQEDMTRLQHELASLTPGTVAYQQTADQIEQLQATHYQKMEALDLQYQATLRKQQQEQLAERQQQVRKIESVENQMLSGLISGRTTWAGMERRIFQQVAGAEIEAALHAATEKLIIGQESVAQRKSIEGAMAIKSIAADAAQAAAAAYRAMVGIPYVGPIIAPAAAAVAFAAVGAYRSLVSFDVGSYHVPHDMPAMVHQGEMILPRPFAEEARQNGLIGGGSAPSGDVHLHVHANDGDDARRFILGNSAAVAEAVRRAARNGAFA